MFMSVMLLGGPIWLGAVPLPASAYAATDELFAPPILLEADGQPIDVEIGHAAPYVYDFDGDGVDDLLVGQFGDGKLRVYRNEGTNASPRYGAFEYFGAGGVHGTVPAG